MSSYLASIARAVRFWSRLPIPSALQEADPHGAPVMADLAPALPVAGALIGAAGAIALLVALGLSLPAWPAAVLAAAALTVSTGAMHEDALADVADGFGGGTTTERKLEIMRDPRIGTYGASALVVALALRISLLAALVEAAGALATAVLIVAAASVSRIAGLWPLVLLPPARQDGLGAAAASLTAERWRLGAIVGAALSAILAVAATGAVLATLATVAAFTAAFGTARLAERQIGGQTGDVCGAATLLAELAFLTLALASLEL